LQEIAAPRLTVCPACLMIAAGRFAGEVRISGTFAIGHRAEIERLIRNEARRAAEDNPLARIVRLDGVPEGLLVRTTTEHLAKRVGQALRKAFHGRVHYRFSHENKFAHVMWSREQ
jgi:NMD protein affecting ribosome stability and mRNA decay